MVFRIAALTCRLYRAYFLGLKSYSGQVRVQNLGLFTTPMLRIISQALELAPFQKYPRVLYTMFWLLKIVIMWYLRDGHNAVIAPFKKYPRIYSFCTLCSDYFRLSSY